MNAARYCFNDKRPEVYFQFGSLASRSEQVLDFLSELKYLVAVVRDGKDHCVNNITRHTVGPEKSRKAGSGHHTSRATFDQLKLLLYHVVHTSFSVQLSLTHTDWPR